MTQIILVRTSVLPLQFQHNQASPGSVQQIAESHVFLTPLNGLFGKSPENPVTEQRKGKRDAISVFRDQPCKIQYKSKKIYCRPELILPVSSIHENALPVLGSQDERQWRAFLFRYIYYVNDRQGKLILSKSSNISLLLYRAADVAHELSALFPSESIVQKYRVSSRMGVINNVILHWVDSGRKETPEELVDYLMSFILNI